MERGDLTGGRGASFDAAGQIVGQYEISGITSSKSNIVSFFRDIDKNGGIRIEDGKIKITRAANDKVVALAEKLSGRISVKDTMSAQDYKDIRAELKGTYTLSKQDRSNIADFRQYMKSSYVKIGKTGMSLDSKYQELSKRYPQYFNASKQSNAGDQLQRINSVLKKLKNSNVKISDSDRKYAAQELRQDLIRAYSSRAKKRA